jgi:hypothetical protein
VTEPSAFEVEMAIVKLNRYIPLGTDLIQEELIQTGGRIMCSKIRNLLILFGIRINCLNNGRNQSLYLFIIINTHF